jgi:hypothetical protein
MINSTIQIVPPAITLIGAVLAWVYSPGHLTVIDGGTFDNAPARPKAGTKRKNTLLRLGLFLAVIGALAQWLLLFVT